MFVVVLEDGETYGGLINSVTLDIPQEVEAEQYEEFIDRNIEMKGQPIVPLDDLLSSVQLALDHPRIPEAARIDVMQTIVDFVVNNYGEI